MKPALFALAMLCSALSGLAEANGWDNLWRNADQRAEQLLRRGDAAAAARVFADPRWKAYAELLAGDYTQAAQALSALDDGDAHYNRGNALAHAGKLQDALNAYDAALARDPNHRDARHNRELVASALKQNPPEQQSAGDQTAQDEKKQGQPQSDQKSTAPKPGQADKRPDGQTGKSADGSADRPSTNESAQPGKAGKSTGAAPPAAQAKTPGSAKAPPDPPGSGEKNNSAATSPPAGQVPESADEAHRDAAASGHQVPPGKPGTGHSGSASEARPGPPADALRPSEQQLAQDQWLRSIPDDPGGLLRRKFLIEHMMRQQKSNP